MEFLHCCLYQTMVSLSEYRFCLIDSHKEGIQDRERDLLRFHDSSTQTSSSNLTTIGAAIQVWPVTPWHCIAISPNIFVQLNANKLLGPTLVRTELTLSIDRPLRKRSQLLQPDPATTTDRRWSVTLPRVSRWSSSNNVWANSHHEVENV